MFCSAVCEDLLKFSNVWVHMTVEQVSCKSVDSTEFSEVPCVQHWPVLLQNDKELRWKTRTIVRSSLATGQDCNLTCVSPFVGEATIASCPFETRMRSVNAAGRVEFDVPRAIKVSWDPLPRAPATRDIKSGVGPSNSRPTTAFGACSSADLEGSVLG